MVFIMKNMYKAPGVDFKKVPRKSLTIPDQSLSIQEIVRRYVRGVPVDVIQREAVYIESDHDLEKLSRMDFAEKSDYAKAMAEDAKELQDELEKRKTRLDEERAKSASDAAVKASEAVKAAAEAAAKNLKGSGA